MIRSKPPEYLQSIVNGPISQPDSDTCQSTCIYAVTGGHHSIESIRAALTAIGVAGDPAVMGAYLKEFFGDRYEYTAHASISNIKDWIGLGDVVITHGWFTGVGHVIVIDGCDDRSLHVMDPWEEFSAATWSYPGGVGAFAGTYSDRLIYAACVAGESLDDADALYQEGAIDRAEGNAWVHRIKMVVKNA